jgi:polyhydroxyalkanoate synthesis repressor PhaR
MAILIKRYANRKLYNTDTSRYITLKGIAELIDCGEEVRVIDNETGEDITKVALSQILVDSERSHSEAPNGLLSQIFERGGDALYGALRKSMDDASENLEELQGRVRRLVSRDGLAEGEDGEAGGGFSNWIAFGAPDMDNVVQNAVERVFKLLDLPRRSDIDALNRNLERVASAVEALERRVTPRNPDSGDS